jgi:hypothetical protein
MGALGAPVGAVRASERALQTFQKGVIAKFEK